MLPASTKAMGQCFAFPDVCKTPTPPVGPIPIPYPNIGMVNMATKESTKVKIVNMPAITVKAEIPSSSGDEAGVAGGVVSGANMQKVTFKKGSSKVLVEGQELVQLTSMTAQNGMNANAPAGCQIVPSQICVLVAL